MTRTTGYNLAGYGDMITDRVRMDAYARAIEQAVRPGCTVLDIGAGTGIFSLLACQSGAGNVVAVEPEEAIQIVRANAEANGCSDRISFHKAISLEVELDRRADVIVSDLRGRLPLLQHHIPTIVDARERLLAPNGRLIPQTDTLWSAVVEAPDLFQKRWQPWQENSFDLDLTAGHEQVINSTGSAVLKQDQVLVPAQQWATLDYRMIDNPNVAGSVEWTVERTGTGHGLALWFDTELAEGIGFSNAPGEPELIYGQVFLPWPEAVKLGIGDHIVVHLRADLIGEDYAWQWRTEIHPADSSDDVPIRFEQSTFFAELVSPEKLRRQEAGHIPTLTLSGQADAYILSQMNGRSSLEEISRDAAARFQDHFPDWKAALTRVGELSVKYGK